MEYYTISICKIIPTASRTHSPRSHYYYFLNCALAPPALSLPLDDGAWSTEHPSCRSQPGANDNSHKERNTAIVVCSQFFKWFLFDVRAFASLVVLRRRDQCESGTRKRHCSNQRAAAALPPPPQKRHRVTTTAAREGESFYLVFFSSEKRGKLVPLIKNHFAVENECKTFPLCKWTSSALDTFRRSHRHRIDFDCDLDWNRFRLRFIMFICVTHKNNYRIIRWRGARVIY